MCSSGQRENLKHQSTRTRAHSCRCTCKALQKTIALAHVSVLSSCFGSVPRHSQIVSVSCARSTSPPLEDRTLHRAPILILASFCARSHPLPLEDRLCTGRPFTFTPRALGPTLFP